MQVKFDSMMLEGQWWGPKPPEAPSIVMLHEGLGAVSTWRDFPQQLAQATGAGVFAYSRAGHGNSLPPMLPRLDSMHYEATDVLPRLLDEIGFREGILLGHSDGGSIVTIYAGSVADDRLKGVVLIEPHFDVEEKNVNAIRDMQVTFGASDLRERLARHHANVDTMFAAWSRRWVDPGFKTFDIRRELGQIRVPIAMLKCEDDPYSTMAQVEIARAECRCPLDVIVIPGSGHSPHRMNPKFTVDVIAKFAKAILRQRA